MEDEDSFGDDLDAAMEIERRISIEREKESLGLDCWEYAWVLPAELNDYGSDRWKVTYSPTWHEGRVLMERRRLADDEELQRISHAGLPEDSRCQGPCRQAAAK